MRKSIVTVALASALVAGVTALHAEEQQGSPGSMKGRDMMGQGRSMMGQTSRMMDRCGSMMQGRGDGGNRPNDQWRRRAPSAPDDNG
jgi:hypothetical protein